ncbi:MAG TPA: hypothetical protein VJ867_05520 [Gemmatimonadaceae bacterium]|nr:hypothetical protein [Gemmatimonadaceae bacterium]
MSRAALVLAASLVAASAAYAQTSFSVAAGATLPIGDAADGMNMGYNLTAGLGIKPPLAPVGARIEGMWSQLPFKGILDGNNARVLAGTVNAVVSGPLMPIPMGYLIGGLGLYNMGSDIDGAGSSTKFGFNIGAGLNIPLTGFGTFIEARLHYITTEGSSTMLVPINFGVKF